MANAIKKNGQHYQKSGLKEFFQAALTALLNEH
jgi:hypothetical protein